jgi:integrator complex subunit 3
LQIPSFRHDKHSEALTAVLLLLRQEKPTADLMKHLMAREVSPADRFVSSAMTYWINEYDEKLGDLISSHLLKQVSVFTIDIFW